VKKMVVSSMAQDVIQRGSGDSELESINGYILDLAKEHGVRAPYNQAMYDLAEQEFTKHPFEPMDVKEVWAFVKPKL
jgi:ketopantoate reductase